MNYNEVLTAIETILRDKLNHQHMDAFSPKAQLNEDLYLDSVLILEIMLSLELDHGVALPEEVISRQDLDTVEDLARLFVNVHASSIESEKTAKPLTFQRSEQEAAERVGVHGEDY